MEELLKNHMFATHAIAAAGSVTLGTALTHPLDTLKTLVQVGTGPGKQLVVAQALDRFRSVSGNLDGREENYVNVSEALLAGIAAGALEALISTPFELFKLRSQVTAASRFPTSRFVSEKQVTSPMAAKLIRGYTPDKRAWDQTVGLLSTISTKPSHMVGALKEYPWMLTGSGRPPPVYDVQRPLDIISLEGWGALWRGLRSGVVRNCIFGGVFFSSWQFLHIAMLDRKAIEMDPPPRSIEEIGPVSPLTASVAAGISGSMAAATSHCFDTATSRSQCIVIPKYVSMERKFLRWRQPGYWIERVSGIHPADRSLLFRGIWLRMACSGFASFIIVGSYFLAVDHLVTR
ncbi:PREDICTED: uncharacterized protein LOC104586661 isoform X2 [Nelumbo nucifera]|uniref:Uncharacterized protein LOC104586661 isoform X2 n=1 Tax=Nelumbo nucifera TaxID=4432 RepID=A0A1U7Z4I7_NELNU|nr:PREDICTED: uncharacterized protein LOC104586661 isoform X2 [Nelumbo nucifera]